MSAADFQTLKLESTIGFGGIFVIELILGAVPQGLLKHPNGINNIYSLGSTVVIADSHKDDAQEFLQGHTNIISCLAVSKDGKYLASGQVTHMGFQVRIFG